ncbi:putative inhibitor of apoptosis isoform X4 [Physella acuta]|uniref:putative inhibitor of apoptosis isoform X4 n=1 Tax=Physella acuta TaxID=109671 RepID=UPI0027DC23DF|nr:putative inhibitor of apoptosis isoform X4 [Physella acuta]
MSKERNNSSQLSASNSAVNSTALNPSSSSALVPSFTPQTRQSSGLEDCTVLEPLQQAALAASVASAQSTTDQKEATVPVSNTSQIRNQSRDPTSPALDVMMDPIHKEYIPLSKRLDSFSAWPRKHLLRDPNLAEGGFNYADASNSTALSHTSVSSTPAEHRPSIPSSTHNQQTGRDRPTNTPTSTNGQHASRDRPTPTYSELGILTERPKRADYALKVKRQESFAGWPRGHHLSVESLVDAGFYYGGYGDCARCFYCGGGLRNWEDEDDVWVEHARWFPKCCYLRQTLGQAFIDTVQSLRDRDQISLKLVADSMGVAESDLCVVSKENLTRDAAVRAVVDLGYLFADVLQAAELVKQEANILSADNIIEKLDLLGKRLNIRRNSEPAVDPSKILENIRAMKEENNQLRLQTICKICMDKEVSVVFLPCGHLVSCGECAVAMRDCPVCRVNVKGIVKASMG